jgi:hypothetical protein
MTTIMWEGDVKLLGIIGVTALLTGLVVSGATLAQEVERPSNYGEKPIAPARVTGDYTADYQVLQPLSDKPGKRNFGEYGEVYYVPSTPETILWGYLPNRNSKPVLTVPSGSTIVFDTVSHEGIQEDQGRNPVNFFGQYGIPEQYVLQDAKAIAASSLEHDFVKAGPHVVTGPLEIEGAQPAEGPLWRCLQSADPADTAGNRSPAAGAHDRFARPFRRPVRPARPHARDAPGGSRPRSRPHGLCRGCS